MKKFLLVIFCFVTTYNYAQFDEDTPDVLTFGAGVGFSSFFGDLATDSKVSALANIRTCYTFNLEKRFTNIVAVQLDGLYGSLAYNERSNIIPNNRNFQSSLLQVGANFTFHMDDDLIMARQNPFSPYLSVGASYIMFDAYSDLKDKNGDEYYYWENGTIRDAVQNDTNEVTAGYRYRDYDYETQLKDSTENYARNSIAFPLTVGLKWKFTPRIQGRIYGTYNITLTDRIDNYKENGDNDRYVFAGLSLHYVLKKKDHTYDDVDFDVLANEDEDHDGIIDTQDQCPHTQAGVEVDGMGCPMDADGDGVPNYLDEEPETKNGVMVDEKGRELTDDLLAERKATKEAVVTQRRETFSEDASMSTLQNISKEIETNASSTGATNKIPEELREADLNNNGIISATEITAAIDGFFEGSNNFTVKALHELIDYFFEQ